MALHVPSTRCYHGHNNSTTYFEHMTLCPAAIPLSSTLLFNHVLLFYHTFAECLQQLLPKSLYFSKFVSGIDTDQDGTLTTLTQTAACGETCSAKLLVHSHLCGRRIYEWRLCIAIVCSRTLFILPVVRRYTGCHLLKQILYLKS